MFGTVEFLQTQFEPSDIGLDETITGFYVTIGCKLTGRDELLARWNHLSFDIRVSSSVLIVLGGEPSGNKYGQLPG